MPSELGDLIQSMLSLQQLKGMQQQMQLQRQQQQLGGINDFMQHARELPDPFMISGLADTYSHTTGVPRDVLIQLSQHMSPSTQTLQGYSAREGMLSRAGLPNNDTGTPGADGAPSAQTKFNQNTADNNVAGANAQQQVMAGVGGFLTQLFQNAHPTPEQASIAQGNAATGMTPEQLDQQHMYQSLPLTERIEGAGVKLGTRIGAQGAAQREVGLKEIAFKWASLGADSALKQQEIDAHKAKASQGDFGEVGNLLATKTRLLGDIQNSKTPMTGTTALSYIGALNQLNRTLRVYGVPTEQDIPYDTKILAPTFVQKFMDGPKFMAGNGQ